MKSCANKFGPQDVKRNGKLPLPLLTQSSLLSERKEYPPQTGR